MTTAAAVAFATTGPGALRAGTAHAQNPPRPFELVSQLDSECRPAVGQPPVPQVLIRQLNPVLVNQIPSGGHARSAGGRLCTGGEEQPDPQPATVTEVDDGGLNGESDVGSDCDKVTLVCNRAALTAPPQHATLSAELCRGNKLDDHGNCKNYNGRADLSYEVTLSDGKASVRADLSTERS